MVKLLVIADDFTGALDTGVQFQAENTRVFVYQAEKKNLREIMEQDSQVLIIDTESRHLCAEEAYQIIYEIVKTAMELEIPYIYKKTDSGMRGNIGSELAAFWTAAGSDRIHFIPAFPKMGRTTVDGIHYIQGVPVAESAFGKDPFEPVKHSAVKEIIAEQSAVPVIERKEHMVSDAGNGIYVYDSASDEDMITLGRMLKKERQLHFLAGCAGFASILVNLLDLERRKEEQPCFSGNLLAVCGSIHAVTVEQIDYAVERGMKRITLSPAQKLTENWIASQEGQQYLQAWEKEIRSEDVILECGVHDLEETANYARENNLEQTDSRRRIAGSMGEILSRLLNAGIESTLLVTGGDTLLAFMETIQQDTLVPICEITQGVVLSQLTYGGKTYQLLSKSGGFGEKELFVTLSELIKRECAEAEDRRN